MAGAPPPQGTAQGFTPKSFTEFVNDESNTWGGDLNISPALNPGDPALALFEANAVVATFLESLLQSVINMARLSTSTGSDVDSFVADYGLSRLPATNATGVEVFSLNAPAKQQILVPVGTIVQTIGGAIQYQVVADNTQSGYDASQSAYVILPGQTSVTATIVAVQAGSASNVQAGLLSQVGSTLTGVTTVNNPNPILNGLDAESDQALKNRFVSYLASLSKGTRAAIEYAINSTQQGLKYSLIENVGLNGQTELGFFTVIVDAGGGTLPAALYQQLYSAIDAVRGFTIQFGIIAPTTVVANVSTQIRIVANPTEPNATIIANVQTAISDYETTLAIGATLYVSAIQYAAQSADPNVLAIDEGTTLINGLFEDLVVTQFQEVIPGTVTVTTF